MKSEERNPMIQQRSEENSVGIQFACDRNPDFGIPFLVTPGIWWVRLPVASALEAVNIYLLQDGSNLTIVDTGVRSAECREALKAALCHPDIEGLTLTRVLVTHYHPDHIGLAGDLARDGVELWASRNTWLNCQLLSANKQLLPLPQEVTFMQRAGLTGIDLEAFRRRAGSRYGALVAPPPDHYVPLVEGQVLTLGHRSWKIVTSYGHAAEHVSLWSDDCVLSGDQILPSIASNLTVPYTEADVDLVGEWLRSCRRLAKVARNEQLCLPGHQRPFYGIPSRLIQIEQNIEKTLSRLQSFVSQPTAAIECVEHVYGRSLSNDERRSLLPEVVGMLNHLYFHGQLDRSIDGEGVFRFASLSLKAKRPARGLLSTRKGASTQEESQQEQGSSFRNHAVPWQHEDGNGVSHAQDATLRREGSKSSARFSRLMVVVGLFLAAGWAFANWNLVQSRLLQWYETDFARMVQANADESDQRSSVVIVPVETVSVVHRTQAELPRQFTGVVKPRRASQVGFNRIGVIDEILVERGDRVESDTVLARLNTNLLSANLKAVQAQYRAAEARLSELVAGPRAQTIESARAQVASAKAELELAKTSFERAERLVKVGAVSKQDHDNAKTQVAAKEEALRAVKNGLDELLEGTRSEQVMAQRAQLSELEASLEQLQVQLRESVLRTPFAAIVSERFVEPGAVAAPGSPAFRLIDAESPEVWIGVPPEFLSAVREEGAVALTIGNKSYPAKVKSVLPELDEATRTSKVIFQLEADPRDESLFGQVAKIELSRTIHQSGFWVPLSALSQGDQGLWALLTLEPIDGCEEFILKRQEVEVVQIDSERVYVRGTVAPGTELVANGVRRLTPGQQVRRKETVANRGSEGMDRSVAGSSHSQELSR